MDVSGYKFADFELDLKTKCLRRQGQVIPLAERQFKLLHLLASASPASLSKKQLSEAIWDEVVVSDWSLFRLISDTRQLLGDDGEQQQIIKTSRGIGFCITPVEACAGQEQAETSLRRATAAKFGFWLSSALVAVMAVAILAGWQWLGQQRLHQAIARIGHYQDNTYTAFKAQVARRNELAEMLVTRLGIRRELQYEKFFAQHYRQMNQQELFVCKQIRAITDSGLYQNNQQILDELNAHPQIFAEIDQAKALQQHLTFWINKYHSVFRQREDMCLLYVGVEDGVPYPSGVDQAFKDWLSTHQ